MAAKSPADGLSGRLLLDLVEPPLIEGRERPAVIFEGSCELSCQQLLDQTELLAGYLSTRIEPGDRVALATGSRPEFLIGYLAILANRAAVVGLHPDCCIEVAAEAMATAGCRLAIAHGEVEVLALGASDLQVLRVVGDEPDGLARCYLEDQRLWLDELPASPDDTVELRFTAGPQGKSRTCAVDHLDLLRDVNRFLESVPTSPERVRCTLPLHDAGAIPMFIASIHLGAPLVVTRPPSDSTPKPAGNAAEAPSPAAASLRAACE